MGAGEMMANFRSPGYWNEKPTYLANVLTAYRKANGFSQEEVAQYLGITRSAYAYYESGKTTPSNDSIQILSRLYAVAIDVFFQPDIGPERFPVFEDPGKSPIKLEIPKTMGELSQDERKVIAALRVGSLSQQRKIIKDINDMLEDKKKK